MSSFGRAHPGVLLECDPTICVYIKHLNKTSKSKGFIIKELDDRHLFIDPSMTQFVKNEVEKRIDSYTFKKTNT